MKIKLTQREYRQKYVYCQNNINNNNNGQKKTTESGWNNDILN